MPARRYVVPALPFASLFFILLIFGSFIPQAAADIDASPKTALISEKWHPVVERLAGDGFSRELLRIVFTDPVMVYDPVPMARKANALLRARIRQDRPGTLKPLPRLHHRYLKPANLRAARAFLNANRKLMDEAAARYHVPVEVLTALFLVETNLGRVTGRHETARILACMAAADSLADVNSHLKNKADLTDDLKPWLDGRIREKSEWAYAELAALLAYARDNTFSPLDIRGSVYGAFGLCQFMPSNAVKFGVDGNGDGTVDLFNTHDALMSMANYLKGHGWTPDMSERPVAVRRGKKEKYDPEMIRVVWEYNHSLPYSRTILAVADRMGRENSADKP